MKELKKKTNSEAANQLQEIASWMLVVIFLLRKLVLPVGYWHTCIYLVCV